MEAERDEPQRDNAEQPAPVRLGQEEQERTAETLRLGRCVMKSCLDQKPPDDQEGDTSGRHSESAQRNRDVTFGSAHFACLQIPREARSIGLNELPDPDSHGDDSQ